MLPPSYRVDPIRDLIPLCSNCQSMIHRRTPVFQPDELRRFQDKGVDGVGTIVQGWGRKPWLPVGTTEQVLEATRLDTPPGGATHWSRVTPSPSCGKPRPRHHGQSLPWSTGSAPRQITDGPLDVLCTEVKQEVQAPAY